MISSLEKVTRSPAPPEVTPRTCTPPAMTQSPSWSFRYTLFKDRFAAVL